MVEGSALENVAAPIHFLGSRKSNSSNLLGPIPVHPSAPTATQFSTLPFTPIIATLFLPPKHPCDPCACVLDGVRNRREQRNGFLILMKTNFPDS